jgi:hypothetical protein
MFNLQKRMPDLAEYSTEKTAMICFLAMKHLIGLLEAAFRNSFQQLSC